MTTIRDFGDGQTVIVHTNDRVLATQLSNYKTCFKTIPYEQEQYGNKKLALVGIDCYFPKKSLKVLLKKLDMPFRTLPKLGYFTMGANTESQNEAG
jgi:coenzyme F420-reducing hydrogenase beta subunit